MPVTVLGVAAAVLATVGAWSVTVTAGASTTHCVVPDPLVAVTVPVVEVSGVVSKPAVVIVPTVVAQVNVGWVAMAAELIVTRGRKLPGRGRVEAHRGRVYLDTRKRLVDRHADTAGDAQSARIGDRDLESIIAGLAERGRGVLGRIGAVGAEVYRGRRSAGCRPFVGQARFPRIGVRPQDREARGRARHRAGRRAAAVGGAITAATTALLETPLETTTTESICRVPGPQAVIYAGSAISAACSSSCWKRDRPISDPHENSTTSFAW